MSISFSTNLLLYSLSPLSLSVCLSVSLSLSLSLSCLICLLSLMLCMPLSMSHLYVEMKQYTIAIVIGGNDVTTDAKTFRRFSCMTSGGLLNVFASVLTSFPPNTIVYCFISTYKVDSNNGIYKL